MNPQKVSSVCALDREEVPLVIREGFKEEVTLESKGRLPGPGLYGGGHYRSGTKEV